MCAVGEVNFFLHFIYFSLVENFLHVQSLNKCKFIGKYLYAVHKAYDSTYEKVNKVMRILFVILKVIFYERCAEHTSITISFLIFFLDIIFDKIILKIRNAFHLKSKYINVEISLS